MHALRSYLPVIKDRIRARRFDSLILFVTSRCNSLCRTCFYFDQLNSKDDLSADQLERLAATAPPFRKLWISGGEPFLRDELAEIIARFVRRCGVRNVNLPTNGLAAGKIFAAVDRLLSSCPELTIDLNFSLDGLANTHDAIRRVPGNFERTLATIRETGRRFCGVRRLRRNVLTVITRENYDEIVALGLELLEREDLDGHYFQVVRGAAPDPSLKILSREGLERLHQKLMRIHRRYAERLFAHLPAAARAFATLYYLGNLRLHFDLHESCLESPSRWPMPCTAGNTTLVIDHNGNFRACELRSVLGNLAEFDFDLSRALESDALRAETRAIATANCWCTHSCFIHDSSKFQPSVQLFHIPWAFFRHKLGRFPELSANELDRFKALDLA